MPSFSLFIPVLTRAFCLLLAAAAVTVSADELPNPSVLKVCADPYMLPFSNQEQMGYENRIAELFAEKLGAELKYEWFPQRIGFIRNTLRAEEGGGYKCDLVITAPENFELAATTDTYYTTTYMLVFVKGRGLDEVTEPEMLGRLVEQGKEIRFGLSDFGPAQLWAFYQGLLGNIVPYQGQPGDPKVSPGKRLIDELVAGNIDATIIWGPTAGYYARQLKKEGIELVMLPLRDDPSNPELRFTFRMAMAVRYGEKEWKEKVNRLISENKEEIRQILLDYGVPLIEP